MKDIFLLCNYPKNNDGDDLFRLLFNAYKALESEAHDILNFVSPTNSVMKTVAASGGSENNKLSNSLITIQ